MKTDNKILAASIAAALLVGGGAVAAFNEMRASGAAITSLQQEQLAAPEASSPYAAVTSEVMAPAHTQFTDVPASAPVAAAASASAARSAADRAPILSVKPVNQSSVVNARVLSVDPVTKTLAQNTPREECRDVVVQERLPERDGNVGGTLIGAVIGGLAGNQVGNGKGRDAATVAGAVAGGYIGNRVDKRHVGGRVVNRTDRQCSTVNHQSNTEKVVAYDVTYRTPEGDTGVKRVTSRPGDTVKIKGSAGTDYDVTYSYNGKRRTVRMDERPSGQYFPVVDGRVMTSI